MRTSKLIDGVVWDGKDPKKYADGFADQGRRWPDDGQRRLPLPARHRAAPRAPTRRRRRAPPAPRRRRSPRRRARPRRAARPASTGAALCAEGAAADRRHRPAGRDLGRCSRARAATFPTPGATFDEAVKVFSDPFYRNGPERPGHRLEHPVLAASASAIGFGLAAAVGIPLGFVIGRFEFLNRMTSPLISLLRPVSPLAWLPIGLLVFKAANPAAIWTIFICSIWPMIINTAVGVQRVPQRLPQRRPRAEPVASGRSSRGSCSPPCCPTC